MLPVETAEQLRETLQALESLTVEQVMAWRVEDVVAGLKEFVDRLAGDVLREQLREAMAESGLVWKLLLPGVGAPGSRRAPTFFDKQV
jgi:hypothetical protein